MARMLAILLIVVISLFLVFEIFTRSVDAQSTDNLAVVLKNQRLILEKLDDMDKKLDILKMRIKL